MRTRVWLNIALLVIAGAIAWWTFGGTDPASESTPLLLNLEKEQVRRIRIEVAGASAIELLKQDGGWRMKSPYDLGADSDRIALLLDFLAARSLGTFPATDQDLHIYGLDRPGFILSIDDHRFEFGAQHPYKPARYLRYNGSVHMIADLVTQHLLAGTEAYVDSKPVPTGLHIASIRVPGLTVEQIDSRLQASVAGTAADTIAQFIEQWRGARAISLRAASSEELASTATDSITIAGTDGTQIGYRILARQPSLLLLRRQPALIYELGADMADTLLKLPPEPAAN